MDISYLAWIVNCVIPVFLLFSDVHRPSGGQAFCTYSVIIITPSAVMYLSTYYKLKKQSRNIALQNATESREQKLRILKEERFLKKIVILACIAFVFTVPIFALFLLNNSLSLPKNTTVFIVCNFMLYSNFSLNPLIYILRLPNYRVKHFICFIAEEKQLPVDIKL